MLPGRGSADTDWREAMRPNYANLVVTSHSTKSPRLGTWEQTQSEQALAQEPRGEQSKVRRWRKNEIPS